MLKHKKLTLCLSPRSKALKREQENENQNLKRTKFENEHFSESNNFIKACELVNQKAHENLSSRLQILHLPICTTNCKHIGSKLEIKQIGHYAEEAFMVEFGSNMWYEALEVSFLSITETTYLSENILKNIIEIMMNAHEDPESQYKVPHLINKCQQVLSMNIKTHPPCSFEPVRKCYLNFLTAPMDLRKNTKTNRCDFDSNSGIFQYCINRLESELHIDSKDEPLFDKEMLIPAEMKQTIQGVHYEKSRLEIFEMLKRTDRIDRLMAVMDSLAELIGFDLAIYHSRLLKGEVSLRRQKILITKILELNDLKHDGMNDLCERVMKIYIYFIHLNYPEKFINTMNFWINSIIETLHTMEKQGQYHKDPDFLKIGSKRRTFALTLHKMIFELPPDSILKIIERITPTHMRCYVGMIHCEMLLSETIGSDIIKTLIKFIEESQWKKFSKSKNETIPEIKKKTKHLTPNNILKDLIRIIKNEDISCYNGLYQKFKPVDETFVNDQIYVTQVLNMTVHAYLDAYHLHKMHKTLNKLNNELSDNKSCDKFFSKEKNRYVTQASVKIYKDIYKDLKKCFCLIQDIKSKEKLPEILGIFENNFDFKEL